MRLPAMQCVYKGLMRTCTLSQALCMNITFINIISSCSRQLFLVENNIVNTFAIKTIYVNLMFSACITAPKWLNDILFEKTIELPQYCTH